MLEGAGGNIAASLGDDGILIVDTEYSPLADKIQAALKGIGITDKPVRFVVDTHYHGDHTDGNAAFGARQARRSSRTKTCASAWRRQHGRQWRRDKHASQPAQPKEALPVITFDDHVTLHSERRGNSR